MMNVNMQTMKIWIKKGTLFMFFKQHDYTFIKILGVWIRYKTKDENWHKHKRVSI